MILVMLAAIAGGIVTVSLVAPIGLLWALVAAPFGGSLCAAGAGIVLASLRTASAHEELDTTDKQVAALRSVLDTAYPAQTRKTSDDKAGRAAA
jgi:hypothetical protein